jgi:hypothetical protein
MAVHFFGGSISRSRTLHQEVRHMERVVERVDVWAAGLQDEPGALSGKLACLAEAGADLEFIVARRTMDPPGSGVVFITPLRGDKEVRAATDAGFLVSQHLHSVRVEGDNQRGAGALLTAKLADAGINLRGVSGAVIGQRYIIYFAFDTMEQANKAVSILRSA